MENQETSQATESPKTALERLEDVEKSQLTLAQNVGTIVQALQPLEQMVRDILLLKETATLLHNKLNAVVSLINSSQPLTDETISKTMSDAKVEELKSKLAEMVKAGVLVAADTVQEPSFVVVTESNAAGIVTVPRTQFLLSNLNSEELKTKLTGAKVGDQIVIGDNGDFITVIEIYDVVVPQAPQAEAASVETPTPTAELEQAEEATLNQAETA